MWTTAQVSSISGASCKAAVQDRACSEIPMNLLVCPHIAGYMGDRGYRGCKGI